jgi:hypothetical protein
MMNGKDVEGINHGLTKVLFWHLAGGTKENYEKTVRIVGIPAKIQTGHLPNTNQNR